MLLTRNGGRQFRDCLRQIFSQEIHDSVEVVVVDSGSTDSTLDEIEKYPVRLFQIEPGDFRFGLTRDYGFSQAQGRIIVTLSQDAVPCDKYWLRNLIAPFKNSDIAAVQGVDVEPDSPDVFFWERKGRFYFTRETKRWLDAHDGIGLSFVNVAIRREVWERHHFGDVPMSEDKVFQKMLKENRYRVYLARDARVYHGHTYTVRTLINRCENEGLGWRYAGVDYRFSDMLLDLLSPGKFKTLARAVIQGESLNASGLLFPLIRPLWLFKGNHFTKGYRFYS
ncbi:MAG: glycosyltransferase [Nitrospirae bacterium]|nr:glycosyltransferase [Nitrospirota bacterium]